MDFVFEQIRTGGDRNFAYLIGDRAAGIAAAVDPAFAPAHVFARAEAQGLSIAWILNTHGHADHAGGNEELARLTGAKVAAYSGTWIPFDRGLDDGDVVEVGAFALRALHVPGHTPDHLLFHLPEQEVAITGDHLFVGKIGGTATEDEARTEYDSLARMLVALPDDTTIWPGHDYGCRPSSTIGLERITNPFLEVPDIEAFLDLKRTWASFKASHGLV